MRKKYKYNKLIELVKSLGMPTKDFAIFGSGPMYPHGLKYLDRDIDIIARGDAWKVAVSFKPPVKEKHNLWDLVSLFNGKIEIFTGWAPGIWQVDKLIDSAEIFYGLRFVRLEKVLMYKKMLNRPKDKKDIALIEAYLGPPFIELSKNENNTVFTFEDRLKEVTP